MNESDKTTSRQRQNCPLGWFFGAMFVIPVVAAVFFYEGGEAGHQATTTTPANAPSVTTGSSGSGSPNR